MGVRLSASTTSLVPSSFRLVSLQCTPSLRGVVGATVYGIYFIMATRPLGYLLPALSGSLKYGEVMGPKWIVLACFIIIIYSWILRLRSSSTCSSMLVGACGSYYSTHMSTILQVLVVSTRSTRLFIVKILGCTVDLYRE